MELYIRIILVLCYRFIVIPIAAVIHFVISLLLKETNGKTILYNVDKNYLSRFYVENVFNLWIYIFVKNASQNLNRKSSKKHYQSPSCPKKHDSFLNTDYLNSNI